MQMDAGLDTGMMLAKRAVEIEKDETAAELSVRLANVGAELLSETLPLVERGEIEPVPQNDAEASYAPLLKREDGLIDWRMSAREVADRVRAFQPWPASYTAFRGGRLIIWRAKDAGALSDDEIRPATIIAVDKSGITVACADRSALRIEEVQIEGKKRMSARDFANGARLGVGDRITDDELNMGAS
jgi:methionyl-tRNA formyltransferase